MRVIRYVQEQAVGALRSLTRHHWAAIGSVVLAVAVTLYGQRSVLDHTDLLMLWLGAVSIVAWLGGVGLGLLTTLIAFLTNNYLLPARPDGVDALTDRLRPSLFASVAILISAVSQARRVSVLNAARTHAESDLQRALETMERRVGERTQELSAANQALKQQMEERLEAEEAYRELFENASDMVFTLNLAGTFTTLNKVGLRMIGYEPGEARWMQFAELVAEKDLANIEEMLAHLGEGRSAGAMAIQILAKDHAVLDVEVTMRVIYRGSQPIGIQGIARSLAERKRLEHELRQAQKLEAIGHLAGGVAHDFNNILMVIEGYSDLALARAGDNEDLAADLREVQSAARRGSDLTKQLLAFSRKQVLNVRPLDLNRLVMGMSGMLSRLIGENIRLDLRPAGEPCPIEADRMQLEQVLMNLAVNARDAMSRGGTLTIAVDQVKHGDASADLAEGPYFRLQVSDTGTGMDDATRERIFEPFFSTKPLGKGTGLGLSTAYGVIKQCRGHVEVESHLMRGTTFTVYLPPTSKPIAVAPETRATASISGGETIMFVEDEQAVRTVLHSILRQQGYNVLVADGPKEALGIARTHSGPINLVLSDVIMPDMSGPEMVALLKSFRPEPQVVFLSGYAPEVLVRDGVLRDDVPLLQKPIAARELLRAVRESLNLGVAAA